MYIYIYRGSIVVPFVQSLRVMYRESQHDLSLLRFPTFWVYCKGSGLRSNYDFLELFVNISKSGVRSRAPYYNYFILLQHRNLDMGVSGT